MNGSTATEITSPQAQPAGSVDADEPLIVEIGTTRLHSSSKRLLRSVLAAASCDSSAPRSPIRRHLSSRYSRRRDDQHPCLSSQLTIESNSNLCRDIPRVTWMGVGVPGP